VGSDLLGACVFCAGTLLGRDFSVPAGLTGEIGLSYATLARWYESDSSPRDLSDVTGKFLSIGIGNARLPEGELGAGTPSLEWRLRVALAPSHDKQAQKGAQEASGDGRYENFQTLIRLPVSTRDSIETGVNRRIQTSADLIRQNFALHEQRILTAERVEYGLGWRHRWTGLEAGIAARLDQIHGSNGTQGAFHISSGTLYGAGVEVRMRRGPWVFAVEGEALSGSVDVHEESKPNFFSRNSSHDALLQFARFRIDRSFGTREASLSITYDRSRLPFVSLAVLGTETEAFDDGFHPDSRTRQWILDASVGRTVAPRVRARVFLRLIYGSETLTLTDGLDDRATRTLPIGRGGIFGAGLSSRLGSPEAVLGFSCDFSLSGAGR
jgi:hypothetical protein